MSGPTWSDVHHDIDPDAVPFLRGWLRVVQATARPLRRVPPTALTVLGVVLVVAAVPLATVAPLGALACVFGGACCDALDGAVAVSTGRVTRSGAVADAVADRISDVALAAVIWRCGAPWWLAALPAVSSLAHEGLRLIVPATRRMLTVDERPTRFVCAGLALICQAITPAAWPATVCASVWAGLGFVGLAQFWWWLRGKRSIRAPRPDRR